MDTVPQDAFATLELSEEGGEGLTGLVRGGTVKNLAHFPTVP